MNIKLDENLPFRVSAGLQSMGHDVQTAHEEGLTGSLDREIWEVAQREARFLITQDLDFSDARRYAPGTHYGLLLVRLRTPNRQNLTDRILEVFREENTSAWARCFVVVTDRKVRVRQSQSQ